MAKRNLNEVLGFISRWGDSDFSLTLLENIRRQREPKERNPVQELGIGSAMSSSDKEETLKMIANMNRERDNAEYERREERKARKRMGDIEGVMARLGIRREREKETKTEPTTKETKTEPSDEELSSIVKDTNYKPEPRELLPGEKVQAEKDAAARAKEDAAARAAKAAKAKEDAAARAAKAKEDAEARAVEAKEKEEAKAAADQAAVENAGKSEKEPGIRDRITNTLRKIGLTRSRDGGPNIFDDELSGGIEGRGEKPSLRSRMLGKISDVTGKAGEIQGMLGAVSGMGASVGQGIIKMSRAQTGRRQDMGANVGGFTQTTSAIASGLDRISVGADRLEDEAQIKQHTKKIEAEMRSLRANRSRLTPEQQKIAAERYKQLERARQDARSKNRFNAARMQRMLDLLNTGRSKPASPTPLKP